MKEGITRLGLGVGGRSQNRAGEVTLLSAQQPFPRNDTLRFRLPSIPLVRRSFDLWSRGMVWVRTYLLESRSLWFRIQAIHARRLVGRYEMGLACQSCQRHGTQYRCKLTQVYMSHMQQLCTRLPWLSCSDSSLVRAGWNLAIQLSRGIQDCGMERDLEGDLACGTPIRDGNSMPPVAGEQ